MKTKISPQKAKAFLSGQNAGPVCGTALKKIYIIQQNLLKSEGAGASENFCTFKTNHNCPTERSWGDPHLQSRSTTSLRESVYFVTKWDSVLLAGIFCSQNKETTHTNIPKGDVLKKSHCSTIRLRSMPENMTLWKKKNRLTGNRKQAKCVWQKCLEHFISWLIPVSFLLLSSKFYVVFFPQHSKITLLPTSLRELGVGTGQHPQICWSWIFTASPQQAEPWRTKPWRFSLTGTRILLISCCACPQLHAWLGTLDPRWGTAWKTNVKNHSTKLLGNPNFPMHGSQPGCWAVRKYSDTDPRSVFLLRVWLGEERDNKTPDLASKDNRRQEKGKGKKPPVI